MPVLLTLGVWWAGRDRLGPGRALAIGVLLALVFLPSGEPGADRGGPRRAPVATPGPAPRRRWLWTGLSLVPLVPLGLLYARIMQSGGGLYPQWPHLAAQVLSLRGWAAQLAWADPLTLGSRRIAPFVESRSLLFAVLDPALWAAVAFAGSPCSAGAGRPVAPGMGMARAAPPPRWVRRARRPGRGARRVPEPSGGPARAGRAARLAGAGRLGAPGAGGHGGSLVALLLQSAFVWDYGRRTQADVDQFLATRSQVGAGHRVGVLVLEPYGRYRPAPRLHVDCLLGLGTLNVIWNNYETAHYYFPVQLRADVPHPPATAFEAFAMLDRPADADARQETLRQLLSQYHPTIDRLVVWGTGPALEPLLDRWYEDAGGSPARELRVLVPRAASAASR